MKIENINKEMQKKLEKKKWNLIIGLIIIFINLYWIWDNLYLMYRYRISGILWNFMYPDWVLITNAILGVIGIYLGILLIREKLKIKSVVIINTLILLLGGLIKIIIL